MDDTDVAADGGASTEPAPRNSHMSLGAVLDRYVVLEKLGQGGMGVVYAAFDPKLDRKIALKLVRGRGAEHAQRRLEREAQALARLRHENVVTVYDVGAVDGDVFIAMEFVRGTTVSQWLRAEPRTWREVLAVYLRAGRGLQAAHDAGLVHRDFKPDNVMLGPNGRVVVMDFGVAKITSAEDPGSTTRPSPPSALDVTMPTSAQSESLGSAQMTEAGALIGTPLYMAPEQFRGEPPPDARTDQFCFCVALYEGLYGERPFTGRTWIELSEAVEAGTLPDPPRGTQVPSWARRALVRGLSVEPTTRFPSMSALLAALDVEASHRQRRRIAAGSALGLAAVAALVAFVVHAGRAPTDPCADSESAIASVWGPPQRDAIRSTFAKSASASAATTLTSTERILDDYATHWGRSRRTVCEATWVRHEQSPALLDTRMSCLDQRRSDLSALATVFAKADKAIVEHAIDAATSLTPADECIGLAEASAPLGPIVKARVAAVQAELSRVIALRDVGKLREAMQAAGELVENTRTLGHAPTRAEALYAIGKLKAEIGDENAESALEEAAVAATEAGYDLCAADSWDELARLVGYEKGRVADGQRYARLAEAKVARAGNPPSTLRALISTRGHLHLAAGEYDQALASYRQALDLLRHEPNYDESTNLDAAIYLNDSGVALWQLGKLDDALAAYQQSLQIHERLQGAEHPDAAIGLANIASIHIQRGRYREAEELDTRALAIREKVFGHESEPVAVSLTNLAREALEQGRADEAIARFADAMKIAEKAGLPDMDVARYANNYAAVQSMQGNLEEARVGYERAIALLVTAKARLDSVALYRANLCTVLRDLGKAPEALAQCTQAIELARNSVPKGHPNRAQIDTSYGDALVGAGKARAALPVLEEALRAREAEQSEPSDLATTRFALARALRALHQSPERAHTLAVQARDAFVPIRASFPALLARVDAWLADPRSR